jgi:hypothetical protein
VFAALRSAVSSLAASFFVVYVQAALKFAIVPIVKSSTFTLAFNLTMFIALHAAVSLSSSAQKLTPHVIYGTRINEKVLQSSMSCVMLSPAHWLVSSRLPSLHLILLSFRLPANRRAPHPLTLAACLPSPKFSLQASARSTLSATPLPVP